MTPIWKARLKCCVSPGTIKANTESNFYRPDLTKALLAKWSLISKSQKKTKK